MDVTSWVENATDNFASASGGITTSQHLSNLTIPDHELNISGLFFLIIPTITVLGNLMVIIAVLRFKNLHSAINFLIFGLAVADLLVGLFVMPYAVYVHVQGGYWLLGSMMCDIYSASDVACSTASILILTVISFDRYRAVTHPISYSHKSHDTKRVIFIMALIWMISLALASPMVLGVNIRPTDANIYECRFYNPIFSIFSSIISFVIPCFIVLFVYIKIMIALHQRQHLYGKQRSSKSEEKETTACSTFDCSNEKRVTEIVEGAEISKPLLASSCDMSELNLGKRRRKKLNDTITFYSRKINKRTRKGRGEGAVKQYDGYDTYVSRNASDRAEMIKEDDKTISGEEGGEISSKGMLERLECAGLPCPCREVALNRFLRVDSKNNENSVIFVPQLEVYKFCELQNVKNSGNKHDGDILQEGQSDELALQDERGRRNDAKGHLRAADSNSVKHRGSVERGKKEEEQLQVDSKFAAKEPLTSKLASEENDCEVKQCDRQQQVDEGRGEESEWHERESIEKGCDDNADRKMDSKIFKKWCIFSRLRKNCKGRKLTQLHSTDSKNNVVMERSSTKLRRPLNCSSNDLSIRRFNRTQRMEKRATKTLGIVVGIFLACWLPFFSVYILSAVCIQMDIKSCQLDFYAFFYSTWLGYINSCVNPIIYTIFNVEFQRAFKRILFGKTHKFKKNRKVQDPFHVPNHHNSSQT